MGKFSDPNYKLLKDYFDILVAVRTGTQKSYLIGPNKTVVSDGGLYTILYEDHPDRGYVGHRFVIQEIDGNRFKMEYQGLESTFSLASSAFDIGNDMYFRKDSFFHYWLARPEQDDAYHDYCNQEKTFLFFGKIWPVSNQDNIYSIEFEGLKDFTLNGIPQTNQTVNMTEWLKVYWDQIHHEMYNMTKTFWSMFDAREIDIRWLGYIASIYGVDISENVLNELPLREWVENLPYFLKRIGTYNALYIIWKVFMANTANHLNVYERWGEWCVQDLEDVKDQFVDYHFLEFYGTQPSGGAGDYYYSQFNPANYPTHATQAPSGNCLSLGIDAGVGENYNLWTQKNLNCSIDDIYYNQFDVTSYDPTRYSTQTIYLSAASPSYSGDFLHTTGIEMSTTVTSASNIVFWALSNEYGMLFDHTGDYLSLSFETSGGNNRYFKLIERYGGVNNVAKTSYAYAADTPYYVSIERDSSDLDVTFYSKKRRLTGDILETITLPLSAVQSYTFLYALNGRRIEGHGNYTGVIYGMSTDNTSTQIIAATGSSVITPHYKVQVDLSTEPLGDIFDDDTIISENIIKELRRNWEYVRPVSKYAHYEELIAPSAQIDRTGTSIPLYPRTSNGYFNTIFTGSQFISAGGGIDGSGVNTVSYYQDYASKTWTVPHNLNTKYLLVQPWVFEGTETGARLVQPDTVQRIDNNTLQLTFNESVRGVAAVAGSASSGIAYTETGYETSPNTGWNLVHNLGTNTPSGYNSDVGPVVMHWDNDGYRVIPDINDDPTDNTFITQWNVAVSGGSLVRRSDYIHYQYDPSTEWNIQHNLNAWVIVQCYDIINDEEITPDKVEVVNQNNLKVTFAENKRGYGHVVQILRSRVIYSPYECDITGIGICAENIDLGYWKIGTGTNSLWNPYVQGDLETPVTSGAFKSVNEDDTHFYIDFIVPDEYQDVGIREVGLFNYLGQLMFYSKCTELFKPEDVQGYFHYRIRKLVEEESSSSSSSSVSSSSSSSSNSSSCAPQWESVIGTEDHSPLGTEYWTAFMGTYIAVSGGWESINDGGTQTTWVVNTSGAGIIDDYPQKVKITVIPVENPFLTDITLVDGDGGWIRSYTGSPIELSGGVGNPTVIKLFNIDYNDFIPPSATSFRRLESIIVQDTGGNIFYLTDIEYWQDCGSSSSYSSSSSSSSYSTEPA